MLWFISVTGFPSCSCLIL